MHAVAFLGLPAPLLQFRSADTDLKSHFNEISQANKGPCMHTEYQPKFLRAAPQLYGCVLHISKVFFRLPSSDRINKGFAPSLLSLCVDADNLSVESSGISGCVGENFSVFQCANRQKM